MRIAVALLFAITTNFVFAQTSTTTTKSQAIEVAQLKQAPKMDLRLMLAQVDPADMKTFVCTCVDAVDKSKVTTATCNKGETCSCNGGAHCTK